MKNTPDKARFAKKVAEDNGYKFEFLDKGENCLFKISNSKASFIAGGGSLASYPLNNQASASIARDKIFTNHVLDSHGIPNLGGKCFFLTSEGRGLRSEGYEIEDAYNYLAELNNTVFCKPLRGSQGTFAEIVRSAKELENYIERCSKKFDAIIIQKYFEGTEYRVFMLGDEPLFCVKKGEVELLGNGENKIADLLAELNLNLSSKGISPYSSNTIITNSSGEIIALTYTPKLGEIAYLAGRKNISSGATPLLLNTVPPILADLALKSHQALGLEISGIDFMCKEINDIILGARVIEVNSNPAISSLEICNRWDLIEKIWLYVIHKCIDN